MTKTAKLQTVQILEELNGIDKPIHLTFQVPQVAGLSSNMKTLHIHVTKLALSEMFYHNPYLELSLYHREENPYVILTVLGQIRP